MHCADANCVTACPSGAQKVTPEGAVWIDPDVCFGCSYCVLACPFDVPKFDAESGVTQKCSLCVERTSEQGLEPMCVQTCPAEAMDFGEWDEVVEKARRRVGSLHELGQPHASTYGEDLLGGLGAIYVLPGRPESFGFSRSHVSLRRAALASWALGLVGSFALLVAPTLLYALAR
jgi:formate dehydrogenase iron-sulfur subunit